MSMTIAEAIKYFSGAVQDKSVLSVAKSMDAPKVLGMVERVYKANELALAALQEKAEREDPKPLTIEELRQMHGEPVWMKEEQTWGIINVDDYGEWKGAPFITFYYKSVRCDWNIGKRGLTCYRHKPKEDHQ